MIEEVGATALLQALVPGRERRLLACKLWNPLMLLPGLVPINVIPLREPLC